MVSALVHRRVKKESLRKVELTQNSFSKVNMTLKVTKKPISYHQGIHAMLYVILLRAKKKLRSFSVLGVVHKLCLQEKVGRYVVQKCRLFVNGGFHLHLSILE